MILTTIYSTSGKFRLSAELKDVNPNVFGEPSLDFYNEDDDFLNCWDNPLFLKNDLPTALKENDIIDLDDEFELKLSDYPELSQLLDEGVKLGFFNNVG